MDLDFYFVLRPPKRAEVATVRMKVTWKVSVSVSVRPRDPSRSLCGPRPAGHSVSVYCTRVKWRTFQSRGPDPGANPPHRLVWTVSRPRLTCSVLQRRGRRGAERRWSGSQELPPSCLLKSLEWTDSGGHAKQTQGLFLLPSNKGLTLLFTLPVKYYRSFM